MIIIQSIQTNVTLFANYIMYLLFVQLWTKKCWNSSVFEKLLKLLGSISHFFYSFMVLAMRRCCPFKNQLQARHQYINMSVIHEKHSLNIAKILLIIAVWENFDYAELKCEHQSYAQKYFNRDKNIFFVLKQYDNHLIILSISILKLGHNIIECYICTYIT